MQSTFEQLLLLGGAVGSMVGGVFAVLSYLKSYKKKKYPPSNPSQSVGGGYFLTGRALAQPTHPRTYSIPQIADLSRAFRNFYFKAEKST